MKLIANAFSITPTRFLAGTCGSYGFAQMEIEFSPEWEGLGKRIVFSPPDAEPVSVVLEGNTVTVPYEVTSRRGVSRFAIFGTDGERTLITVTGEIDVLGTLPPDASNSVEPTPSEMEQVLGYMEQAISSAESVREAADAGEFNGKDAGFGEVSASVRTLLPGSVPTVSVRTDGPDTAKEIHFSFGLPPADATAGKRYSVRFSGSSPSGIREDDAAGMVAEVAVGAQAVRNDFDAVPFFNRPICCCRWEADKRRWQVVAYRGEPGFSFDGSCGEVMYECTPFFYRIEMDGEGAPTYVSVTGSRMAGYELAPMFQNDTDKVYCPCFPIATVNGKWTSRAGVMPDNNSLNGFMSAAKAWQSGADIETAQCYFSDALLLFVEFATKNWKSVMSGAASLSYNQSADRITRVISSTEFEVSDATAAAFRAGQTVAIGSTSNGTQRSAGAYIASITGTRITLEAAVTGLAVGDYLSSRMYRNGCAALAVVNASSGSPGSNTDRHHPCIWRGKENPWGNGNALIGNLLTARRGSGTSSDPYRYRLYYLPDTSRYNSGKVTADYAEADFDMASSDGYAKTVLADSRHRFVIAPGACGASSSTYIGAYYHYPRHAVDSVHVGGSFMGGDGCGLYMDCSTDPAAYTIQHVARFHLQ